MSILPHPSEPVWFLWQPGASLPAHNCHDTGWNYRMQMKSINYIVIKIVVGRRLIFRPLDFGTSFHFHERYYEAPMGTSHLIDSILNRLSLMRFFRGFSLVHDVQVKAYCMIL